MRSFLTLTLLALLVAALPAQTFRGGAAVTAVNSTSSDYSASLTADNLTMYFTSARAGGAGSRDVWMSQRTSENAPWGVPTQTNLAGVNTAGSENYVCVRGDDLELYVSVGPGTNDMYVSTRLSTGAAWGAATLVTVLNSAQTEDDPTLTGDGLEIYFTSDRPGGVGGASIWRSTRATLGGAWAAPTVVTELNTTAIEHSPAISGDNLTMIWSSTRPGGTGSSDHYIATRASTAAPFGAATELSEINTAAWDHNGQQTADGFTFYYATSNNIYAASLITPQVYSSAPPKVGNPYTVHLRSGYTGDTAYLLGSLSLLGSPVLLPDPPVKGNGGAFSINLAFGQVFLFLLPGGPTGPGEEFTVTFPTVPGSLVGLPIHFQGAASSGGTFYLSNVLTDTVVP